MVDIFKGPTIQTTWEASFPENSEKGSSLYKLVSMLKNSNNSDNIARAKEDKNIHFMRINTQTCFQEAEPNEDTFILIQSKIKLNLK